MSRNSYKWPVALTFIVFPLIPSLKLIWEISNKEELTKEKVALVVAWALIGIVVSYSVGILKGIQSELKEAQSELMKLRQTLEYIETTGRVLTGRVNNGPWEIVAISKPTPLPDSLPSPGNIRVCETLNILSDSQEKEKWSFTISVLNYQRLQDLLWSPEYLQHFIQIGKVTGTHWRILIVSDHERHQVAIEPFKKLSDSLGVKTVLVNKSEWYDLIGNLSSLVRIRDKKFGRRGNKILAKISEILKGNPDLSVLDRVPGELRDLHPEAINLSDCSYLLRHQDEERKVVEYGRSEQDHSIEPIVVGWVCWILTQGTRGRDLAQTPFRVDSLRDRIRAAERSPAVTD